MKHLAASAVISQPTQNASRSAAMHLQVGLKPVSVDAPSARFQERVRERVQQERLQLQSRELQQ